MVRPLPCALFRCKTRTSAKTECLCEKTTEIKLTPFPFPTTICMCNPVWASVCSWGGGNASGTQEREREVLQMCILFSTSWWFLRCPRWSCRLQQVAIPELEHTLPYGNARSRIVWLLSFFSICSIFPYFLGRFSQGGKLVRLWWGNTLPQQDWHLPTNFTLSSDSE